MNEADRRSPHESLIDAAYSAEYFHELAQVWQNRLTAHLKTVLSAEGSVLDWSEPETLVQRAESLLAGTRRDLSDGQSTSEFGQSTSEFEALIQTMLAHGQNLHHPRYIGHQVPASVPIAGLFDAVGSITNQPMAVFEMGPWATAVEHALVRVLCKKVGWEAEHSAGLLTSGGSLANLTALLTARNVVFPDSWEKGLPENVALIAHADAHYCVARSAGILGIGTRQIVSAPLDTFRRIDPEQLDSVIRQMKAEGRSVLAVVACACATPIGAFDPLTDIAEICQRHSVWLHVDAAHGGGVLMSRRHRHLLNGLDQADSLVWDAHKMMFVPALCAAVLYRSKAHRFEAFRQDAPYLFDPTNPGMAEFESGMRTLECTKRSLGFGLWGIWSLFGERLFEEMVDRTFELAAEFHQLLVSQDDFEPLHVPDANIVVFRHLPEALQHSELSEQNAWQQRLRAAVVRSGEFYIVQTVINGVAALRVTMMNPMTSPSDLVVLTETIRSIGKELL